MSSPRSKAAKEMHARPVVACSNCGRDTKARGGICGKCTAGHEAEHEDYSEQLAMMSKGEAWKLLTKIEKEARADGEKLLSMLPVGQVEPAIRNDPPVDFEVPEIGKARRRS